MIARSSRVRHAESAAEVPVTPERTSAVVQAEIDALVAERAAASARIKALEDAFDATLLTGDDTAAEANEAERAKLAREVRRADLRLPALREEAASTLAREEAALLDRKRAEAEAAVQAVLTDLESGYTAPAREISAFLGRWQAAGELARAAGIEGPDRIRAKLIEPERFEETREEPYTVYLDTFGRETQDEFETRPDGTRTNDPKYRRKAVTRTRTVIASPRSPARYRVRSPLATLVNLPGVGLDEDAHVAAPGLATANQSRVVP